MKPSELVERAMKAKKLQSRYALHKLCGLPEQSVANWAKNKAWPNNDAVLMLAELAGLDALEDDLRAGAREDRRRGQAEPLGGFSDGGEG